MRAVGEVLVTAAGRVLVAVGMAVFAVAMTPAPAHAAKACLALARSSWTEIESWAWEGLCSDGFADLDEKVAGDPPSPNKVDKWGEDREIRASFLEQVLSEPDLTKALGRSWIAVYGARVVDEIDLSGTVIPVGIDFHRSRLAGLDLSRSVIKGDVDLSGSYVERKLNLTEVDLQGDLFFEKRGDEASRADEVDLSWSTVAGGVYLKGSVISTILDANDVSVGDRLSITDAAVGAVDLSYCSIAKNFHASRATISEELKMYDAEVDGSVFFTGGKAKKGFDASFVVVGKNFELDDSSVAGELDLRSAGIGKHLILSGAHFGVEPQLRNMEVGISVDARHGVEFVAGANFTGTHVAHDLDLSGSIVSGPIDLSRTRVDGPLVIATRDSQAAWQAGSSLALDGAVVDDISDAADSWPAVVGLNGFIYQRADGVDSPDGGLMQREQEWYDDWLARSATVSRQPYEQLADHLRTAGRASVADHVAIGSEDAALSGESLVDKVTGTLYKYIVGYGYEPWRALIPAAVFILVGAVVLRRLPKDPAAPSHLVLSTERLIPFLTFGEAYRNVDLTSSHVPAGVRRYFYVHTIVGFMLAAFLLAGLSGLTSR